MRVYLLAILTAMLLATVAWAQATPGHIWIDPPAVSTQNDRNLTFEIEADANLTGLKGIHFDIDFTEPSVFGPDSSGMMGITVSPGNVFVDNDTITFFWDYLWADSSRLTVDVFVLTDSQTVDGPGILLRLDLHSDQVFRGSSEIQLNNIEVRDRFNDDIEVTSANSAVTVCQYVGDVNNDNRINIVDVTYFVLYMFEGGDPPIPPAAGDSNCDNRINIVDVTMLVDYLFSGGSLCGPCVL